MQRFSWIVVLIVISGGIWFTSRYFYDEINDSKFYFVVVLSLLITLLYSISSKGFHTLRQGLNSRSFILGVSLIGLALSVHGLLQYAYIVPPHTVFPITGPFENPAGYVAVQCSCLPFSIYLCLHNKVSWSIRTLAIISSLLIILTIVLSGSRCGMLAASVAIVVILALETKAATYLKKHKSILLAIVLFFISGVFLLYKQRPTSADGRLLIWSVCWEMIKDKPITGFGINGFHANYMDYQAAIGKPSEDIIDINVSIFIPPYIRKGRADISRALVNGCFYSPSSAGVTVGSLRTITHMFSDRSIQLCCVFPTV